MTAARAALAILGTASFTYAALALWWLPWLDFGVSVAISAACVIGLELCRAIKKDRERQRQYREQVWQRRIDDARTARPGLTIIKGGKEPEWLKQVYPDPGPFGMNYLKPWPIGDDEVRS